MATTGKAYPAAGSMENAKIIKLFCSGNYVGYVYLLKDKFDGQAAQDKTDLNVHVSSTITGMAGITTTTLA